MFLWFVCFPGCGSHHPSLTRRIERDLPIKTVSHPLVTRPPSVSSPLRAARLVAVAADPLGRRLATHPGGLGRSGGRPPVGLDPIQIREIRTLIRDLAASGHQTVILSTHILAEVEAICQRVILLGRGRKVLDQPLAELMAGGVALEEVFTRVMTRDASDALERGVA